MVSSLESAVRDSLTSLSALFNVINHGQNFPLLVGLKLLSRTFRKKYYWFVSHFQVSRTVSQLNEQKTRQSEYNISSTVRTTGMIKALPLHNK